MNRKSSFDNSLNTCQIRFIF